MLWLLKIECFLGRFVGRFPFGAILAPNSSIPSRGNGEVVFGASITNRTDVGLGLGIEIKQAASRELESEGFGAGMAVNENRPGDRLAATCGVQQTITRNRPLHTVSQKQAEAMPEILAASKPHNDPGNHMSSRRKCDALS